MRHDGPTEVLAGGELTAGARLGPYLLEARIGAGGMGSVYRAIDTRLQRPVAIKVSREQFSARFEREAKAISSLNHPHICTIHDVGPNYLVMELVEGESLAARLQRGKLVLEEVRRFARQIADALAAAHDKGIIHRDLKPGNIMLGVHGVKVVDFGLAKSPDDDALTQQDARVGTPAYMAPEQFKGRKLDARSDLFAFGLLLYEMLTGRRPIPGASLGSMMASARVSAPPASAIDKSIPAAWDPLLASLLAVNPQERPGSAREVGALIDGMPLHATQQNRRILPAVAAIVAVLVGGLAYGISTSRTAPIPQVQSIAVLPFQNETGDSGQDAVAGGLTLAVQSDLSRIPALRVVTIPNAHASRSVDEISRTFGVDAVAHGSLRGGSSEITMSTKLIQASTRQVFFRREHKGAAADLQRLQREVSASLATALRVPLTAPAKEAFATPLPVSEEAYHLYLRGRYHSGRDDQQGAQTAIDLFERAAALEPGYGPVYAELARAYGVMSFYYYPNDPLWEERGFAAVQRAMAIDPNSAESHFARGVMLWRPSHGFPSREALADLRRATEIRPSFDEAWHQHGLVAFHVGHLESGMRDIDRALSINPGNVQARFRYGPILIYQGKYEEAILRLNQIPRQIIPTQWSYQMAWALLSLGRREEAAMHIEETLREVKNDQGGVLHAARAMLRALAGNRRGAEADIAEAIRIGKNFGHFHHTAYSVGAVYSVLGDYDKALRFIEQGAANGFPNYTFFENDPHLKGARTSPKFRELLARLRREWEHIPGEPD
ncbi:MAG: protein kinase [Bryobacterales bacterium]|nr:protein kinase [Bryobacterales bacterium]